MDEDVRDERIKVLEGQSSDSDDVVVLKNLSKVHTVQLSTYSRLYKANPDYCLTSKIYHQEHTPF